MNNRSAFFKIFLVVLILVGLSEISFSQLLTVFPEDSARWYLQKKHPNRDRMRSKLYSLLF